LCAVIPTSSRSEMDSVPLGYSAATSVMARWREKYVRDRRGCS
jgi:hypothetical protein